VFSDFWRENVYTYFTTNIFSVNGFDSLSHWNWLSTQSRLNYIGRNVEDNPMYNILNATFLYKLVSSVNGADSCEIMGKLDTIAGSLPECWHRWRREEDKITLIPVLPHSKLLDDVFVDKEKSGHFPACQTPAMPSFSFHRKSKNSIVEK